MTSTENNMLTMKIIKLLGIAGIAILVGVVHGGARAAS